MTMLAMPRRDLVALLGLAMAAGAALWWWGISPAARWLDHGSTAGQPAAGPLATLAVFSAAWLLMTVGTMVPTTAPLLDSFARVSAVRPRRGWLTGAVIAGFICVWGVAGVVAGVVDLALHELVHTTALHAYAPLFLALALGLAGIYQLSGPAARCRRGCRSPISFLSRHWTGEPDVLRQSLAIGADYGRSCLGCCAPLMVVMLAVGMSNLAWMYGLALLGGLQKGAPWGEALAVPLGIVLLVAAAVVAVGQFAL
jgi:predicted metal-binding membrane protein